MPLQPPPRAGIETLTSHRYTDLQPVGMGAFGLVWYALLRPGLGGTLAEALGAALPKTS